MSTNRNASAENQVARLEMPQVTSSSLDRFIWDRAGFMVGGRGNPRAGFIALLINAIVQSAVGLTFLGLSALLSEPDAKTTFFIMGSAFGTAAIGLATATYFVGKKTAKIPRPQVKLRPEGQLLLRRIATHIGWANPVTSPSWTRPWWAKLRTAEQVLDPETFSLLDRAAFQFNRLTGLLNLDGSPNSALTKMAPTIQLAMTETMTGIFNQVGCLQSVPESALATRSTVESDIQSLTELGDRVEAMRTSAPSFTDQLSNASPLQGVLDQLRMEEIARSELRADDRTDEENPLRG